MSGFDNSEKNVLQGQHLLADIFGIDDPRLGDPVFFTGLLKEMAASAHLTPLSEPQFNQVDDHSCNGFFLLKDAHISIYAVPKSHYLAVDIFIFGELLNIKDPEQLFAVVTEKLSSQMIRKTTITRGLQN